MPNRIIREGIIGSDSVNELDWPEEVFYRRLLNKVDDYGLYDARHQFLRATLYPLKIDRVREADISRWMAACQKAGLIVLYEAGGKPYLKVLNTQWEVRSKPKYPLPDNSALQTIANNCAQLSPLSLSLSKTLKLPPLPPQPGGEGEPGAAPLDPQTPQDAPPSQPPPPQGPLTGSKPAARPREPGGTPTDTAPRDTPEARFLAFWKAYPKKKGKGAAEKRWAQIRPARELLDLMLQAIAIQKKTDDWRRESGRFIPHPATWLNEKRWEDEVDSPSPSPRAPALPSPEDEAALRRIEAEEKEHAETMARIKRLPGLALFEIQKEAKARLAGAGGRLDFLGELGLELEMVRVFNEKYAQKV